MTHANHPSGDAHWTRAQPDRLRRGADSHAAKLTEAQIAQLRDEYRRNRPRKTWLAERYGVSRQTIWRHVQDIVVVHPRAT